MNFYCQLKRIRIIILSLLLFFCNVASASSEEWKQEKGIHFIVFYSSAESSVWARSILRAAETYYRRIADNINYSRYRNFWTWEDRVNIVIYENKETFLRRTNQPEWSKGATYRDADVLRTKMIVTYKQEEGFLDGILPHEISHLILGDFIGFEKFIPIWFNEGVAQLQERRKRSIVRPFMKKMVEANAQMPLDVLMTADVRKMHDLKAVAIFYGQSLSIVDFLITKYGSSKFGEMCVLFRNERDLEEALRKAYLFEFRSLAELEKKWLSYVKK